MTLSSPALGADGPLESLSLDGVTARRRADRVAALWRRHGLAVTAYGASRAVVFVMVSTVAAVHGASRSGVLTGWDGRWYLQLARHGYPSVVPHGQSTLGFLPVYPLLMRAFASLPGVSLVAAGVLINQAGGLASTILLQRLTAGWWGEETARRATLLYAFFPGTVVFSMVYSDGLFLALVMACLLCLDQRRWWAAGAFAAVATATGADGFALVGGCATAAGLHIWRTRAWRHRRELVSLAAPGLAPAGLVAFGAYLWARVGSPLASLHAQRRYWGNHVDTLSLFHHYQLLLKLGGTEINLTVGLLGVPFVIGSRFLLYRLRDRPPGPTIVWGAAVTVASLFSAGLTPNPRMLLFSFPSAVVVGRYLRGPAFAGVILASVGALVWLSWATLSGWVLP